jgi:hypothetical protein
LPFSLLQEFQRGITSRAQAQPLGDAWVLGVKSDFRALRQGGATDKLASKSLANS